MVIKDICVGTIDLGSKNGDTDYSRGTCNSLQTNCKGRIVRFSYSGSGAIEILVKPDFYENTSPAGIKQEFLNIKDRFNKNCKNYQISGINFQMPHESDKLQTTIQNLTAENARLEDALTTVQGEVSVLTVDNKEYEELLEIAGNETKEAKEKLGGLENKMGIQFTGSNFSELTGYLSDSQEERRNNVLGYLMNKAEVISSRDLAVRTPEIDEAYQIVEGKKNMLAVLVGDDYEVKVKNAKTVNPNFGEIEKSWKEAENLIETYEKSLPIDVETEVPILIEPNNDGFIINLPILDGSGSKNFQKELFNLMRKSTDVVKTNKDGNTGLLNFSVRDKSQLMDLLNGLKFDETPLLSGCKYQVVELNTMNSFEF